MVASKRAVVVTVWAGDARLCCAVKFPLGMAAIQVLLVEQVTTQFRIVEPEVPLKTDMYSQR